MRSTKSCSVPLMCSAMAMAQSFAETTAMHLSISSTLICSPSSRYTQLPPKDAARALAVTVSSSFSLPLSMSSTMSSIVITFVTLAGNMRSCAFFSYSTSPVYFSISIADGAEMLMSPSRSGSALAAGQSRTAKSRKKQMNLFMAASDSSADMFIKNYEDRLRRIRRFTKLCIIRQSEMHKHFAIRGHSD